ncbi:MAG: Na(+)/H(+) antiporter subunit B [Hyphomicrobiales bacterium]|nr:Na(+)/H(+) antiporter subunit B [Hyphomicrobiales bacterium]
MMQHHLVLRVIAKLLFAPILLFAFYVQFHGDFGPGGGFQAGLIFASAFVLHGLLFDVSSARQFLPDRLLQVGAAVGVLLYAGTGLASVLLGGNFLDYDHLAEAPTSGQHLGIILVEAGVGITVACVVVMVFRAFADHLPCLREQDW